MLGIKSRIASWIDGSWIEHPVYWVWGIYRPHTWGRYGDRCTNRRIREVLVRVLKPDSPAVDIGCCHGEILQAMIDLAPRGYHYAFEPVPELAASLRERFPAIHVHEVALSDRAGSAEFFHSPAAIGYSSLCKEGPPNAAAPSPRLTVRLDSLDAVLPPDLPVAFIKIDVEGAELDALRGARGTLGRCRPVVVFEHAEADLAQSESIFALLSGELRMNLQSLAGWLAGKPPFSRDEFLLAAGRDWNFVASPA